MKSIKRNKQKMLGNQTHFTRNYEFIIMLRSNIITYDIKNELSSIASYLTIKLGGKLILPEYWGLRPLSYEIQGNKKAHFYYFGISIDPLKLKQLHEFTKNNQNVIRYIILKTDKTEAQMKEKTVMMKNLPEDIEKEMGEIQWNQANVF